MGDIADDSDAYELAAAFLIVLLRWIYDGPKLMEGPLTVDTSTALQALSLASRLGELTEAQPVTASALNERLRRWGVSAIEAGSGAAPRFDIAEGDETVVCTQFSRGGRWYCFKLPSVKGPPPGPPPI